MKTFRITSAFLLLLPVATGLLPSVFFTATAGPKSDKVKPIPPEPPTIPSSPLPAVPTAPSLGPTGAGGMAPVYAGIPRKMKLLVIAATGLEPSYQAITYFLDYLGVPYQRVVRNESLLPMLTDGSTGEFQGIILATGNLGICDPECRSALTDSDWIALDTYARDYGVRTVAWYAFPNARFGLKQFGTPALAPTAGTPMAFTTAASSVFPYLNRTNPLKVKDAYYYPAISAAAAGETTTPLLTINGLTVGALHTKADGREYMAFTFDSNPYLTHSLAVQYGAFNWVTKGLFLGSRKAYFHPQNDDHFLENDLFQFGVAACMPSSFTNDPTYDAGTACPTDRMDSGDIKHIASWQDGWNKKAQFNNFKVTMAFNGYGAAAKYGGQAADGDGLTKDTIALRNKFFWVNHTYNHEDLDCYNPVPNSSICTPASYQQSVNEIALNVAVAKSLGLPLDSAGMVTPGISGLNNPNFMAAAAAHGLRYLAADTSRPEGIPAYPNTGIRSSLQPSILLVPRRATSIYYNTKSAKVGADGSLPDEYNYFYGPTGLFQLNGLPWYNTVQTYSQILERESDALVSYMLRGENYPIMFHQSNFIRYTGDRSLFSDVVDAAFAKFSAISTLPVMSLAHSDVGRAMESRAAYISAKVTGILYPGQEIVLTGSGAATVPVTGICKTGCEVYGGQSISQIPLSGSVTVSLR